LLFGLPSWLSMLACHERTLERVVRLPGLGREYRVYTRRDHDASRRAPVLFVLHPYFTDPMLLEHRYQLRRVAAGQRGWIVVFPVGHVDSKGVFFWNATRACCDADRRNPDDVAFLDAVLADVRRTYAIDPARIYAFGESNGGFMAHRWACEPNAELAAIVSIAGAHGTENELRCDRSRPVSVLQVHGTADRDVRYDGGTMYGPYPSAEQTVAVWQRANACHPEPAREERRDLFAKPVQVKRWSGAACRVELWSVIGGGHVLEHRPAFLPAALDFLASSRSRR
jgi:polyhydroxybutyrate depolymerase